MLGCLETRLVGRKEGKSIASLTSLINNYIIEGQFSFVLPYLSSFPYHVLIGVCMKIFAVFANRLENISDIFNIL